MNQNTTTQNDVRKNIITMFEIDKLPEDKQEEMINRVGNTIFQSVLIRVLPMLKEDELAEYEKLLENDAEPDALFDFFFEKIPSFFQIVTEESENLREESEKALKEKK